jgi:hypothetical protein
MSDKFVDFAAAQRRAPKTNAGAASSGPGTGISPSRYRISLLAIVVTIAVIQTS